MDLPSRAPVRDGVLMLYWSTTSQEAYLEENEFVLGAFIRIISGHCLRSKHLTGLSFGEPTERDLFNDSEASATRPLTRLSRVRF
jgi:hypothetical protein